MLITVSGAGYSVNCQPCTNLGMDILDGNYSNYTTHNINSSLTTTGSLSWVTQNVSSLWTPTNHSSGTSNDTSWTTTDGSPSSTQNVSSWTTTGILTSSTTHLLSSDGSFSTESSPVVLTDSILDTDSRLGLVTAVILQIVAFFPCILGNLVVFIVVAKYKRLLRIQSNFFIVNLTLADFLVGILLIPLETVVHFHQIRQDSHVDNGVLCSIHRFLTVFLLGSSLVAMLMISIDRYIAIIYPFFYTKKVTPNVIKFSIAAAWCFMFALCVPILSSLRVNPDQPNRHCGFPCAYLLHPAGQAYAVIIYSLLLIIFVGNITLYTWVARTALKQHSRIMDERNQSNTRYQYNSRGELSNTKIMVIMFGVFILFWLPYLMVVALHVGGRCLKSVNECEISREITLSLGILNSSLNCYIYAWQKKDFKFAIRHTMRLCKRRRRVAPTRLRVPVKPLHEAGVGSLFTVSTKLSSRPTEMTLIATCHDSDVGIHYDNVSQTETLGYQSRRQSLAHL